MAGGVVVVVCVVGTLKREHVKFVVVWRLLPGVGERERRKGERDKRDCYSGGWELYWLQ